jgi:biotin carboxyl carrier protein
MKSYTITVNGNVYDVTVEEGHAPVSQVVAPKVAPTPVAVPSASVEVQPAKVSPQATAPVAQSAGSIQITAGAAGKVVRVEATVGQAVKKGEAIVILEAMKMEIPVVAPQDGTVAGINVIAGEAVEAGKLLATLA